MNPTQRPMTDGCQVPFPPPVARELTLGEVLDKRITDAREEVERLCNLKARAEACNLLKYPSDFINKLGYYL